MYEKGEILKVQGREKKKPKQPENKKGCFAYMMLNLQTSPYTWVSPFQPHSAHKFIAKAFA